MGGAAASRQVRNEYPTANVGSHRYTFEVTMSVRMPRSTHLYTHGTAWSERPATSPSRGTSNPHSGKCRRNRGHTRNAYPRPASAVIPTTTRAKGVEFRS
eukprot:14240378-Alexandrium_andersonii.AAC.1